MKTRDKIVQASLALFNEHGERNITTNHIAAHLGISPGNLYYHFRNKEDIIRSIFSQYEEHLASGFQPYRDQPVTVELLMGYFDAMFYVMWQFRFMYANLADILSRDEELKRRYLTAQQQVLSRCSHVLSQLRQDGYLAIDADKVTELADTIKMIVSFWISYQLTQSDMESIAKHTLYEGLLRVLMIFRGYATPLSEEAFVRLEQHYRPLACV
ncbi:TetR family transcriptional regulator [Shewanella sp. NFH-SH190041]|uniref:TetR/AcrR family transcriptional regulator n=1 Tax=Shewanella sp. NFH-SH190041 TaxID=2950245 RepID=UPI0021C2644E|nr:TetR/AcrR family transcriptional regulator [Shewanella sp. NFH-SH190041]BDM62758.1 TetR family transcriptional regulator [Shewanella sp. NFH-SH190041]